MDCDEVFPGILLGNGATVKKKEYLDKIGVSHVLNAAEFRYAFHVLNCFFIDFAFSVFAV